FGTGTFIMLNIDANNLYLQFEDGATGQWLYIGNAFNFTATSHRVVKLSKVPANSQPIEWRSTENFYGSPFRVSELWSLGTTGDTYCITAGGLLFGAPLPLFLSPPLSLSR